MNKSILLKYKSKATIAIVVTAAIVVPTLAEDNDLKVTWKDTFRLESADGNNKLKFGGRIHWQNAFFSDDEFGGKLLEDGEEFRRSRIYVSGLIRERYDFAGGDASRLMQLAIGYSYRGDDTATYKLSSDHSLAPNWKYKVSDVDNTKVPSLEGAL